MSKYVVMAGWNDAPHLTEEGKADLLGSIPAHLRDARTKGIPQLGSGAVFPVPEEDLMIDPIQIPEYWAQIGGMDFGWDHPFASVHIAWDRDSDTIYVCNEYRKSHATPLIHSAAINPWGFPGMPWAWPHDGQQHGKGDGKQLSREYEKNGLNMLPEFAKFEDGGWGVEAGLALMLSYMEAGRFKVFRHLADWFEEYRLYHRKDGKLIKEHEDLMSATRYGVMCLRFAITYKKKLEKWRDRLSPGSGELSHMSA